MVYLEGQPAPELSARQFTHHAAVEVQAQADEVDSGDVRCLGVVRYSFQVLTNKLGLLPKRPQKGT